MQTNIIRELIKTQQDGRKKNKKKTLEEQIKQLTNTKKTKKY